jgi:hypothetical protein
MELKAPPDLEEVQQRYARWLAWCSRAGLALLVIGFLAYVTGLVDPHVPIERLPALWHRSAAEVLREIGLRPGWGWAELTHRSDMLILAGIGMLASCSIPCLAAAIPVFHARRERIFVAVCLLQIAVLALAGSGILSVAH